MSNEQTIEATIQNVQFENGWYRVNTDQGEFSTKFQDRGVEAQQFIGQRVLLAYQQGEPRQGRNGQVYVSRYLARIDSPGYVQPQLVGPQGLASPPQATPQAFGAPPLQQQPPPNVQQPVHDPARQQAGEDEATRNTRIMRQTAGKLAVWTLPLVPSEQRTFENQLAIAEAWMRYFIGGAAGTGLQPGQFAQQVAEQVAEEIGDPIPF